MIVFNIESGILMSDVYGYAGNKELMSFGKKARLTRDHLKSEGHPTEVHYIVPQEKRGSMHTRGATLITFDDVRSTMQGKVR